MGMIEKKTITVLSGASTSDAFHSPGRSLVGLILPALSSATIGFDVSPDGTTWTNVYTNSGTPAALTLGAADTGSKAVAVPEEVGRLASVCHMRLKLGANQGADRTITGLFELR